MIASSDRRPWARGPRRAAMGLAVAALVVLGGCTHVQRAPSSYAGAQDNFLRGCQDVATQDANSSDAKVKIASPKVYCDCVWTQITKNVPWDTFKQINSDLSDNGGPLPESFQKAYDSCDPSATSASKSTTTTPKGG